MSQGDGWVFGARRLGIQKVRSMSQNERVARVVRTDGCCPGPFARRKLMPLLFYYDTKWTMRKIGTMEMIDVQCAVAIYVAFAQGAFVSLLFRQCCCVGVPARCRKSTIDVLGGGIHCGLGKQCFFSQDNDRPRKQPENG